MLPQVQAGAQHCEYHAPHIKELHTSSPGPGGAALESPVSGGGDS